MFGEAEKHQGAEKIICGLETLKPTEVSRIQDILKILYDMCDVV